MQAAHRPTLLPHFRSPNLRLLYLTMSGARFTARLGALRPRNRPPLGLLTKASLAGLLALSSIVLWSIFSSPASSVSSHRLSFTRLPPPLHHRPPPPRPPPPPPPPPPSNSTLPSPPTPETNIEKLDNKVVDKPNDKSNSEDPSDSEDDADVEDGVDVNPPEDDYGDGDSDGKRRRKRKPTGPVFNSTSAGRYTWKLCAGHHHNYIPCVDLEGRGSRHRHTERSCPRSPVMCLVAEPEGYRAPVAWPESETKIWYKNVAHPQLSKFVRSRSWLNVSGEYLMFLREGSEVSGARHYLDSIGELVPDIEWGKNLRVILDIQCTDSGFGATVLGKDVLVLSFGLMSDQTDLAQLTLERGLPAVVGSLGTRRLPFPSGVFDAIHCGECSIPWHASGGRLLLEMNRILRPGGYFIVASKHGDIDHEEGMATLTASICWSILAHKTDEESEMGVKIYQRPTTNDIYELRRRKNPPLCKEDENQDSAWYVPIKTCLHKVPAAVIEHGADWPEEWPKRLETFPDWLGDLQEKLIADDKHWNAIITKSYLIGMGIDWPSIRNVMDMKAIYGGFAAALASQKVWVMNVVPVNAPNTLPIIFERGLLGIYHDWCEPFSTYPRSYDLLHADHLFSRLKGRCKQPVFIVVEMDRIVRPGGWAIVRDKLEILNPLEMILKTLHWEVRMSYGKDKEGILCVQKTSWRP